MEYSLDKKDRRILHQLDINARQANTQIAKNVGVSKQVTGNRIKKYQEKEMVFDYFAIIDISKLGFTIHKAFLRLHNLDESTETALINHLEDHDHVVWAASCFGSYDLAFGIRARDMEHLDDQLTQIDRDYGEYIAERRIATIIRGQYFVRDYLLPDEDTTTQRESFFEASPTPVEMDHVNWHILQCLGMNARMNTVDIAHEIDMSADTVAYRLRKMKNAGVIRGYNIVPNEPHYPYLHYKVLLGLNNVSEERRSALVEYCNQQENIVYIVNALGPWEFEIDTEVEETEQLRSVMMELKTKFNDFLKDYSILHIYQVHTYNFCPSTPEGY